MSIRFLDITYGEKFTMDFELRAPNFFVDFGLIFGFGLFSPDFTSTPLGNRLGKH